MQELPEPREDYKKSIYYLQTLVFNQKVTFRSRQIPCVYDMKLNDSLVYSYSCAIFEIKQIVKPYILRSGLHKIYFTIFEKENKTTVIAAQDFNELTFDACVFCRKCGY